MVYSIKRIWNVSITILLFAACATSGGGINKEAGLATGKPGMNIYPTDEPGETAALKRPYDIAPPLVPHSVSGITITRGENGCLECHLESVDVGEGHLATKVPPSHFKNEYTGEMYTSRVADMRYNCLQCHVPQTKEEPPVSQMER